MLYPHSPLYSKSQCCTTPTYTSTIHLSSSLTLEYTIRFIVACHMYKFQNANTVDMHYSISSVLTFKTKTPCLAQKSIINIQILHYFLIRNFIQYLVSFILNVCKLKSYGIVMTLLNWCVITMLYTSWILCVKRPAIHSTLSKCS